VFMRSRLDTNRLDVFLEKVEQLNLVISFDETLALGDRALA